MTDVRSGQCLCGAVKFTAALPMPEIQACHCAQCQRWTGGGPLYSIRVADVAFEGEEAFASYRASTWGERVFCKHCGSTITWRMQGKPVGFVSPGLFDDQTGLALTEEIFTDCRAPWMSPVPGASQSTEAEEIAKLDAFLKGEAT